MDPSATIAAAPPPPPPPQPMVLIHRSYGGNSFAPLIVALTVIAVLGALAVLMGRVCFGRRTLFGYGRYDLEAWVETKCASCVDGRMDVVHPRPRHVAAPPPPPAVASPPPTQPTPPEVEASNGASVEKGPEQPPGTNSEP